MPTLEEEVDMASYANRLEALHADLNLFNRVKFFIRDLLEFEDDGGALSRLLQDRTPKFYMTSAYFTPEQVDFLISFKGRDGRTLEEALQSHIARKIVRSRNASTSRCRYENCPVHDLAPVVQDLFGVKKDFHVELGFKCLFNKFAMKRSD